jgi:hypothetical protein
LFNVTFNGKVYDSKSPYQPHPGPIAYLGRRALLVPYAVGASVPGSPRWLLSRGSNTLTLIGRRKTYLANFLSAKGVNQRPLSLRLFALFLAGDGAVTS